MRGDVDVNMYFLFLLFEVLEDTYFQNNVLSGFLFVLLS